MDLQATIEFAVELYKFYNVDLFQRGWVEQSFPFGYFCSEKPLISSKRRRNLFPNSATLMMFSFA